MTETRDMRYPNLLVLALCFNVAQEVCRCNPASAAAAAPSRQASTDDESGVRVMFDTDMGNDIDDALALGVIHALQSRGECRLLAVTTTKDNEFCAPFIDLVNVFYGRGDIPIGAVRNGKTPEDSPFLRVSVQAKDNGEARFPHRLRSSKDAPEAVALIRQVLARQPDRSVVMIVVGLSTNMCRLLESAPDEYSPLAGRALVEQKCRLLSIMAGMYSEKNDFKEYNVVTDLPASHKVCANWPTPIVASGFEIGLAVKFPAVSIDRDFAYVKHHPVREAYCLYREMPYDREAWDLTSVLYAVRPDRGYFGISEPGTIQVDAEGVTRFVPSPEGRHRYLKVDQLQIARVREALVQLASQPPSRGDNPVAFRDARMR